MRDGTRLDQRRLACSVDRQGEDHLVGPGGVAFDLARAVDAQQHVLAGGDIVQPAVHAIGGNAQHVGDRTRGGCTIGVVVEGEQAGIDRHVRSVGRAERRFVDGQVARGGRIRGDFGQVVGNADIDVRRSLVPVAVGSDHGDEAEIGKIIDIQAGMGRVIVDQRRGNGGDVVGTDRKGQRDDRAVGIGASDLGVAVARPGQAAAEVGERGRTVCKGDRDDIVRPFGKGDRVAVGDRRCRVGTVGEVLVIDPQGDVGACHRIGAVGDPDRLETGVEIAVRVGQRIAKIGIHIIGILLEIRVGIESPVALEIDAIGAVGIRVDAVGSVLRNQGRHTAHGEGRNRRAVSALGVGRAVGHQVTADGADEILGHADQRLVGRGRNVVDDVHLDGAGADEVVQRIADFVGEAFRVVDDVLAVFIDRVGEGRVERIGILAGVGVQNQRAVLSVAVGIGARQREGERTGGVGYGNLAVGVDFRIVCALAAVRQAFLVDQHVVVGDVARNIVDVDGQRGGRRIAVRIEDGIGEDVLRICVDDVGIGFVAVDAAVRIDRQRAVLADDDEIAGYHGKAVARNIGAGDCRDGSAGGIAVRACSIDACAVIVGQQIAADVAAFGHIVAVVGRRRRIVVEVDGQRDRRGLAFIVRDGEADVGEDVVLVVAIRMEDVVHQRDGVGTGLRIGQLDREQNAARAGCGQRVAAERVGDRFLADRGGRTVERCGEGDGRRAVIADIERQRAGIDRLARRAAGLAGVGIEVAGRGIGVAAGKTIVVDLGGDCTAHRLGIGLQRDRHRRGGGISVRIDDRVAEAVRGVAVRASTVIRDIGEQTGRGVVGHRALRCLRRDEDLGRIGGVDAIGAETVVAERIDHQRLVLVRLQNAFAARRRRIVVEVDGQRDRRGLAFIVRDGEADVGEDVVLVVAIRMEDVVHQRDGVGTGLRIGQLDREQNAARAGCGQRVAAERVGDRFLADRGGRTVERCGEGDGRRAVIADIERQRAGIDRLARRAAGLAGVGIEVAGRGIGVAAGKTIVVDLGGDCTAHRLGIGLQRDRHRRGGGISVRIDDRVAEAVRGVAVRASTVIRDIGEQTGRGVVGHRALRCLRRDEDLGRIGGVDAIGAETVVAERIDHQRLVLVRLRFTVVARRRSVVVEGDRQRTVHAAVAVAVGGKIVQDYRRRRGFCAAVGMEDVVDQRDGEIAVRSEADGEQDAARPGGRQRRRGCIPAVGDLLRSNRSGGAVEIGKGNSAGVVAEIDRDLARVDGFAGRRARFAGVGVDIASVRGRIAPRKAVIVDTCRDIHNLRRGIVGNVQSHGGDRKAAVAIGDLVVEAVGAFFTRERRVGESAVVVIDHGALGGLRNDFDAADRVDIGDVDAVRTELVVRKRVGDDDRGVFGDLVDAVGIGDRLVVDDVDGNGGAALVPVGIDDGDLEIDRSVLPARIVVQRVGIGDRARVGIDGVDHQRAVADRNRGGIHHHIAVRIDVGDCHAIDLQLAETIGRREGDHAGGGFGSVAVVGRNAVGILARTDRSVVTRRQAAFVDHGAVAHYGHGDHGGRIVVDHDGDVGGVGAAVIVGQRVGEDILRLQRRPVEAGIGVFAVRSDDERAVVADDGDEAIVAHGHIAACGRADGRDFRIVRTQHVDIAVERAFARQRVAGGGTGVGGIDDIDIVARGRRVVDDGNDEVCLCAAAVGFGDHDGEAVTVVAQGVVGQRIGIADPAGLDRGDGHHPVFALDGLADFGDLDAVDGQHVETVGRGVHDRAARGFRIAGEVRTARLTVARRQARFVDSGGRIGHGCGIVRRDDADVGLILVGEGIQNLALFRLREVQLGIGEQVAKAVGSLDVAGIDGEIAARALRLSTGGFRFVADQQGGDVGGRQRDAVNDDGGHHDRAVRHDDAFAVGKDDDEVFALRLQFGNLGPGGKDNHVVLREDRIALRCGKLLHRDIVLQADDVHVVVYRATKVLRSLKIAIHHMSPHKWCGTRKMNEPRKSKS